MYRQSVYANNVHRVTADNTTIRPTAPALLPHAPWPAAASCTCALRPTAAPPAPAANTHTPPRLAPPPQPPPPPTRAAATEPPPPPAIPRPAQTAGSLTRSPLHDRHPQPPPQTPPAPARRAAPRVGCPGPTAAWPVVCCQTKSSTLASRAQSATVLSRLGIGRCCVHIHTGRHTASSMHRAATAGVHCTHLDRRGGCRQTTPPQPAGATPPRTTPTARSTQQPRPACATRRRGSPPGGTAGGASPRRPVPQTHCHRKRIMMTMQ